MRQFIVKALERAGHIVRPCEDGLSAHACLSLERFDLLLTDIVMPGMDGIELARRATALFPTLKVIFITGFAAMAMDDRNALSGSAPIIAKPFHLGRLIEQVDAILAE